MGGVNLEQAVGILASVLSQPWLGVEAINLRDTAIHIEEDHTGGPGRMMQRIDHARGGPGSIAMQQRGGGNAAKPTRGLLQQPATGQRQRTVTMAVVGGRHWFACPQVDPLDWLGLH